MRVSQFFGLNQTQPYLDFVDVRLDTDIKVFVDPSAIRTMKSPWANQCISLLQDFFKTVLTHIRGREFDEARTLLASLNERNEFHLGFSKGRSKGHAIGIKYADLLMRSFGNTRAAQTALLEDLEDSCLMIDGVGPDLISDAICNIIRGPLLQYTQNMAAYYGIPLTPNIDSGPTWNSQAGQWEHSLVELPMAGEFGPLILVPKSLVRYRFSFNAQNYYRHYLLPAIQIEELNSNSALVRVLKNKNRKVYKKDLVQKYGKDKSSIAQQTLVRQEVLKEYKQDRRKFSKPLTHGDFAELEGTRAPNWNRLIDQLASTPPGADSANEYHDLISKILSALCFPHLVYPVKEAPLHEGRKRVDIRYTNEGKTGFFDWVARHYPAPFFWVECKNYTGDISNPEVDQLACRFSPSRGKVGLLVHRTISNKTQLLSRCKDVASDDHGFIISLDDNDILALIEERRQHDNECPFTLLRSRFEELVS